MTTMRENVAMIQMRAHSASLVTDWLEEHDALVAMTERKRLADVVEADCSSITEEYGACDDCTAVAETIRKSVAS